ncbi:hypothetical protein LLQ46_22805 [Rouxiella badensis]|uniref:hypothetical protein n=1 Tax=Rouxiella badensis TaxID=1646377 RepID=UPI001B4D1FE0|nr:hypothetical protein [Rouxiella badensis]MCC3749692.1 hypothetical protein [Rouxiella badensis]
MKAILFIAMVILLSSCNNSDDKAVIANVEVKITNKFKVAFGGCEAYSFLKESESPEFRREYLRHCDWDIDPNSVKFSEMKVYHHEAFTVVCGTVSGRTNLSRQGARFVEIYEQKNGALIQSKYSGVAMRNVSGMPVETYRSYYKKYCN